MKRPFLVVVALALLLALLPFSPAFATPASAQTVSISPLTGSIGTSVSLTATGLTAAVGVVFTVTFEGITVVTGTVTVANTVTTTFTVPAGATPGSQIVVVTAGSTSAFAFFEVSKGIITLSVGEGIVGSRVTVTGTGFARSISVSILFDGESVVSRTTSATGTFSAPITVPESAAGAHSITAQTSSLDTSDPVEFTVKPTLTGVVPSSGAANTLILVSGKGFAPSDTAIKISLGPTQIGTVASNDKGSIVDKQVGFAAFPGGTYEVKATDSEGNSATAETKFTVKAAMSPLSPAGGNVGTPVTVTGTGFPSNASISLTLDGAPLTPATAIKADSSGSLRGSFNMPKAKAGAHTIGVTDGVTALTATWTMESTAPAAPTLRTPINNQTIGALRKQSPAFAWSEVADPSGVTYDFQLARDATFSVPVLTREDLTVTTLALSKAEALERGLYYWRVRATDGADNVGAWTTASALQIGWPIPMWALVLLGLLALAIIALFAIVISRSMVARV